MFLPANILTIELRNQFKL